MKISKLKLDSRGIGLVEVLICVAIIGFISIAIARMMTSANNSNRNIAMTLEASSVTQLLTLLLSDKNFCDVNFTQNNVVEFDLNNIATVAIPINKMAYPPAVAGGPPGEVIFDRANPVPPGNSVKIADISLANIKSLNSGLHIGKLNIVFDKGAVAGPAIITRSLYLRLETAVVSGSNVRVLHCSTSVGSPPSESAPPPTPGQSPPPDQQEMDDKLFQNLLAGVKNTIFVNDKVNLVMDMISTWQKLGLVSMGRYMTVSKFNTLLTDGAILDTKSEKGDLCNFFSGKIIDVANAPLATPTTITTVGGTPCSVYLAK